MENFDKNDFEDANVSRKKSPAFVGLLVFLSVIGILAIIIATVLIPLANKNLSNIGIKSVNDFVGFYKEINKYVSEDEIVDEPFSVQDYSLAYEQVSESGLDIFVDDENVSSIDEEKIDFYKESGYIPSYSPIKLTDKQLAALFSNALKNNNLIEKLDVKLIEKYKLELEIKELSISKFTNLEDSENEYFSFKTIGKVSLKEIASTLPWPYNGMVPDLVYVTIQSIVKYDEDGVEFSNCKIRFNKVSDETQGLIIDVINSQIKDDEIDLVTLDGLSEYLNQLVYSKIENFARLINGKIKIVEDENNVFFEITYDAEE